MWFRTWFNRVMARPNSDRRRSPVPRAKTCRPAVEALDDRLVPATLSVGDAAVFEGNTGTQYAVVSVNLDAPARKTVSVNYATAYGTAVAGADYLATAGTLTFAPGQTSKTIRVPVIADRVPEPDKTFLVNLSGARGAKIAVAQGVVTILDDEPRISIGRAETVEGNSGTTALTFTVSLSAAYDKAVTVTYATVDGMVSSDGFVGAALAGEDYIATSGTLTFAPGETTKTITVEVLGDTTPEPHEQFYMVLSPASTNALIIQHTGGGVILDDDGYSYGNWPYDYGGYFGWYGY